MTLDTAEVQAEFDGDALEEDVSELESGFSTVDIENVTVEYKDEINSRGGPTMELKISGRDSTLEDWEDEGIDVDGAEVKQVPQWGYDDGEDSVGTVKLELDADIDLNHRPVQSPVGDATETAIDLIWDEHGDEYNGTKTDFKRHKTSGGPMNSVITEVHMDSKTYDSVGEAVEGFGDQEAYVTSRGSVEVPSSINTDYDNKVRIKGNVDDDQVKILMNDPDGSYSLPSELDNVIAQNVCERLESETDSDIPELYSAEGDYDLVF
jgi:hypothetical protein